MNKKQKKKDNFENLSEAIMEISRTYVYWHDKEWNYGVGCTLRRADVHTIQAIGNNEGINLTDLAARMGVTKPTISEKIAKLVKNDLVEKRVSSKNNKEVMFFLTGSGRVAYEAHEKKHKKMYEIFEDHFGEDSDSFVSEFRERVDRFADFLNRVKDKIE